MRISTDNGPIRNMFGDVKAVEMIAAAGFDGIDYTFYDISKENDILALPKLHAVQWQMGDGKKPAEAWLDVYRKIRAGGKEAWIVGEPESYLKVLSEIHGTPYYVQSMRKDRMELAERVLKAR